MGYYGTASYILFGFGVVLVVVKGGSVPLRFPSSDHRLSPWY